MSEEWKVIREFPKYAVSNKGRVKVRNYRGTGKVKILRPHYNFGYRLVCLYGKEKPKTMRIHRLVAIEFIPNPKNKPQVNHLDQTRDNNKVDNLVWATSQENNTYGDVRERLAIIRSKGVTQILNGKIINKWLSATEAQRIGGFRFRNISQCCTGVRKSHAGYQWKFTNKKHRKKDLK